MTKCVRLFMLMSIWWFLYPDEAWCSGCKKCNQRATELRQRLLEQQQQEQALEPQGYDLSMTDWGKGKRSEVSDNGDTQPDKKEKKKKKKKKKDKEDSSK